MSHCVQSPKNPAQSRQSSTNIPEVRNERLFIATIAVAPAIQSSKSKTQEFLQKQNQTDASNKHNQQNIPFSNLPSN